MPKKVAAPCDTCKGSGKHGWIEQKTGTEVIQQLPAEDQMILLNALTSSEEITFRAEGIGSHFTCLNYHFVSGY